MDYKFIIESPSERERETAVAYLSSRVHPRTLASVARLILSRTRFRPSYRNGNDEPGLENSVKPGPLNRKKKERREKLAFLMEFIQL